MQNAILKKFETTNVVIEMINGVPMFELYSVGMALGYVKIAKGSAYPRKERIEQTVEKAEITTVVHNGQLFLTENQIYDFMLEAHTNKCKTFKKWLSNDVLPTLRRTGGYVETNREEEFVNTYFSDLSDEVKEIALKDLRKTNKRLKQENEELKEFYDTLLSTEGLLPMNVVAKEVNLGVKRLYLILRNENILFYKGNVNIPYQKYMDQELFKIKETPCKDGNYRPATYVTHKGLEYIRKVVSNSRKEVVLQ